LRNRKPGFRTVAGHTSCDFTGRPSQIGRGLWHKSGEFDVKTPCTCIEFTTVAKLQHFRERHPKPAHGIQARYRRPQAALPVPAETANRKTASNLPIENY